MTLCDGRGLGPDLRPRGHRRDASPNADVATPSTTPRFWDLLFEAIASFA